MTPEDKKTAHAPARREARPAPEGFKRPKQFSVDGHIGINQVYARIKDGTLPHLRLGRTILIPADALDRIISKGLVPATEERAMEPEPK